MDKWCDIHFLLCDIHLIMCDIVWYCVILCDIHLIFVKAVSTKKGFMAVVADEGLVVTCTAPTGSRASAVFIVRHIINIHLLNECGLVVI